MENVARYSIRISLSQERMTYLKDDGKGVYHAKDGSEEKGFPALEWLVSSCSHIPSPGEHMVRCDKYSSNVARGTRQKLGSRITRATNQYAAGKQKGVLSKLDAA